MATETQLEARFHSVEAQIKAIYESVYGDIDAQIRRRESAQYAFARGWSDSPIPKTREIPPQLAKLLAQLEAERDAVLAELKPIQFEKTAEAQRRLWQLKS